MSNRLVRDLAREIEVRADCHGLGIVEIQIQPRQFGSFRYRPQTYERVRHGAFVECKDAKCGATRTPIQRKCSNAYIT